MARAPARALVVAPPFPAPPARVPQDWDVDMIPFTNDDFSYALGAQGSTRRKLAKASGCILEYVGMVACIAGGHGRARARAIARERARARASERERARAGESGRARARVGVARGTGDGAPARTHLDGRRRRPAPGIVER